MEEVKNETKIEQVEQTNTTEQESNFKRIDDSISKLLKENELLKKEVLSLKESMVNVNPVIEQKAYEVNEKLWKDKL